MGDRSPRHRVASEMSTAVLPPVTPCQQGKADWKGLGLLDLLRYDIGRSVLAAKQRNGLRRCVDESFFVRIHL